MYLQNGTLDAALRAWGQPERVTARVDFTARELRPVERCLRRGRAHDVTLMIRHPNSAAGAYAVIRKHSYPAEVFRAPSGGVHPGESFEAGALREAWEETGLEVRLEQYLLLVEAEFHYQERCIGWTTHVVVGTALGDRLEPVDRREIAEARWATVDQMQQSYRNGMLRIGTNGFRYRVDLQDACLGLMGHPVPTTPAAGRVIDLSPLSERLA